MCYFQRFRDRYVYPLRGVPYFVPPTKASSIRTYSKVNVLYHLCLAVVFSHHPTDRISPTNMYCGRARRKSNPERFTATFPYVLKIRTVQSLRPNNPSWFYVGGQSLSNGLSSLDCELVLIKMLVQVCAAPNAT